MELIMLNINSVPDYQPSKGLYLKVEGKGDKQRIISSSLTPSELRIGKNRAIAKRMNEVVAYLALHEEYFEYKTKGLEKLHNNISRNINRLPSGKDKDNILKVEEFYKKHFPTKKTIVRGAAPRIAEEITPLPELNQINDRIFGFIHGDTFLKQSGLEGGVPTENLRFLIPYLKLHKDKEGFSELIEMLETTQRFSFSGEAIKTADNNHLNNITTQSKEIADYVSKMPKGKKLVLAGGWSAGKGGHAVLYVIERDKSGHFHFSILNTGSGINYHESKQLGLKKKYSPILSYRSVESKVVKDLKFYKALLELNIIYSKVVDPDAPEKTIENEWTHGAKDLYERILPSLGGTVKKGLIKDEDLITAQRSGTCSFKSIMKLIRSEALNQRDYKRLVFNLRKDSLVAYLKKCEDGQLNNIELVNRSCEKFAIFANKLHKQGYIDNEELKAVRNLIKRSKDVADQLQEKQIEKKFKSAPSVKIKENPYTVRVPPSHIISPGFHVTPVHTRAPALAGVSPPPPLVVTESTDIKEMIDGLSSSREFIEVCQERGNSIAALNQLETVVASLPPCKIDGNLWDRICEEAKEEDLIELMNLLGNLNSKYFYLLTTIPKEKRGRVDQLAVMTNLLLTNSKISEHLCQKKYPELANKGFAVKPTRTFIENIEKNPHFKSKDSRLQENMSETLKYFNTIPSSWFEEVGAVSYDLIGSGFDIYMASDEFKKRYRNHMGKNSALKSKPELLKDIIENRHALVPEFLDIQLDQYLLHDYFTRNPSLENIEIASFDIDFKNPNLIEMSFYKGKFFASWKIVIGKQIGDKKIEFSEIEEITISTDKSFEEATRSVGRSPYILMRIFSDDFPDRTPKQTGLREIFHASPFISKPISGINLVESGKALNAALIRDAATGLTPQETENLAYILSVPDLVIPQVLSYLQDHKELIADENYQPFIEKVLFSTLSELTKMNDTREKINLALTQFLSKEFVFYENIGDVSTMLYILSLIQRGMVDFNLNFDKEFIRTNIYNLIRHIDDSTLQDRLLSGKAASLYISTFIHDHEIEDRDLKRIAMADLTTQIYGTSPLSERIENDVHEIMDRAFPIIAKQSNSFKIGLTKEAFEKIFQMKDVEIVTFKVGRGRSQQTRFGERNHGYNLNVETLTCYQRKNIIGNLPREILDNNDFQQFFSNKDFIPKSPKPGIFELKVKGKGSILDSTYRVYLSYEKDRIIIEKKVGLKWYTWVPAERLTDLSMKLSVSEDDKVWFHQDRRSRSGFIENAYGQKIATIETIDKKMHILKYHPGNKDHKVPLLDISRTEFRKLYEFQPQNSIRFWGNKTIEFPHLGLEFDITDEETATLKNNPDIKLSLDQSPPKHLAYFRGYLHVEHKGETAYIIPRNAINLQELKEGALKKSFKLETTNNEFYLFTEKNGNLSGKNTEENLFLGYLHLAHKDYHQARVFFDQINASNPKGYTKKEREIFDMISKAQEKMHDESPQAMAVKLAVQYLIRRNIVPYERDFDHKKFTDEAARCLENNYQFWKHTPLLRLSPGEELDMLEYLRKYGQAGQFSSALKMRYAHLTGKKEIELVRVEEPQEIELSTLETVEIAGGLKRREHFEAKALLEPKFLDGDENFRRLLPVLGEYVNTKKYNKLREMKLDLQLLSISDSSLSNLRDYYVLLTECDDKNIRLINDQIKELMSDKTTFTKFLGKVFKWGRKVDVNQLMNEMLKEMHKASVGKREAPSIEKVAIKRKKPPVTTQMRVTEKNRIPLSPVKKLSKEGVHLEETKKFSEDPASEHLLDIFTPPEAFSPVMKKEFERLKSSISENQKAYTSKHAYLLDKKVLEDISQFCDTQNAKRQKEIAYLENRILTIANQLPTDPAKSLQKEMKLLGKTKRELTINELILAFGQNDPEKILKANPSLSKKDIQGISNRMILYLYLTTESAYLVRLQTTTDRAIENYDEEDAELFIEDVDSLIRENRNYTDFDKDRLLLVFEHFSGFRLRPKQVDTIRAMGDARSNLVTQLIMGSGKSKVILPILANLMSRGDNIPLIVVPDELFETNTADMQSFSREFFNQQIDCLIVPKGRRLTVFELEEMIHKLELVKTNKNYCMMNAQDVHALRLQCREALLRMKSGYTPEDWKRCQLLKEILYILKNEADVLIDEVDLVLDCLKEVNFAGGEIVFPNEENQNIVENILNTIIHSKELNAFFEIEKETSAPFDKKKYEHEIKEHLTDEILRLFPEELQNEEVKKYLLKDKSVETIPSLISDHHDIHLKNQLAICKEVLNTFLPLICSKNCDEHYGLSKKEAKNLVIPYARSNTPSEGSEFGNTYETMLYSGFYYLRKGVQKQQFKSYIEEVKKQVIIELQNTTVEGADPYKTEAYQDFVKSIGRDTIEEIRFDLFNMQDRDLDMLVKHFNKSPENKMRFIRNFAWKEIEIHTENLVSNSQHLPEMFKSVQGFTGTLWNDETYHPKLNPKPDLSVDGRTLSLLTRQKPEVKTFSDDPEDIVTFYDALKGYYACIDVGAWFRGIPGRTVAANMLMRLGEDIKGVVYFNDVDSPPGTLGKAVVLEKGEGVEPIPLSESTLSEEERFTFYSITTGADVSQHKTAKALVTIGKNVTTRDILQGVWRMRGLESKQRVDFALPEDLASKALEEGSLDNILLFAAKNQAIRQESDNFKSLKNKMELIVDRIVDEVILDPKLSEENTVKVMDTLRDLKILVREAGDTPYESFGHIDMKREISEVTKQHIEQTLNKLKQLAKINLRFDHLITSQFAGLVHDLNDLVNKEILPEMAYDLKQNTDKQVEIRKEVQTEKQIEVEIDVTADTTHLPERIGATSMWQDQSEHFWSPTTHFTHIYSINDYMRLKKDHLPFHEDIEGVFSPHLKLSYNFTQLNPFWTYYHEDNFEEGAIPFLKGSKPYGLSVVTVNENNEVDLTFVDANEANFLMHYLNLQKEYDSSVADQAKEVREMEKALLGKINRLLNESYRDGGQKSSPLTEMKSDTELLDRLKSISSTLKKEKGKTDADKFKERWLHSDEVHELSKEIKYFMNVTRMWKPSVTYQDAVKLFENEGDVKMFLFDTQMGVIAEGKEAFKLSRSERKQLVALNAQAKFIRGVLTDYTEEEVEYLKEWVIEQDPDQVEQFLLRNVFARRPEDQKKYPYSLLCRVINEARTVAV